MVRMRLYLILFFGVASLAGCRSATRSDGVPGFASGRGAEAAASADVDPRVAQVEQDAKKWFNKAEPTKREESFSEAKANLKDPEGLYLKQAEYLITAAKSNPEALEQARQIYSMLLKDDPRNKNAMLGLAKVDLKADRLEDAERMFKTVVKRFPADNTVLASAAQFYNITDRPSEAVLLLKDAVKANPESRELRQQMGVALASSGRAEEAVPHFTKVSGQARAYAQVGRLLFEQGDRAAAEQYSKRALQRNPTIRDAQVILASMKGSGGGLRHAAATDDDVRKAPVRQADTSWFDTK